MAAETVDGSLETLRRNESSVQRGVRGNQSVVRTVHLTRLNHRLRQGDWTVETRMDDGAVPVTR